MIYRGILGSAPAWRRGHECFNEASVIYRGIQIDAMSVSQMQGLLQ